MENERQAIRALDTAGTIYAIYDADGNVIGTGTQEVCETLLYIADKSLVDHAASTAAASSERRSNVRSAIAI